MAGAPRWQRGPARRTVGSAAALALAMIAAGASAAGEGRRADAGQQALQQAGFISAGSLSSVAAAAGAAGIGGSSLSGLKGALGGAKGGMGGSGSDVASPLPRCCQMCVEEFASQLSLLQISESAKLKAFNRFRAEAERVNGQATATDLMFGGASQGAEAGTNSRWGMDAVSAVSSGGMGAISSKAMGAAAGGAAGLSGSSAPAAAAVLHPTPSEVAERKAMLPCCPVCPEEFSLPEDVDDGAGDVLLEVEAAAGASAEGKEAAAARALKRSARPVRPELAGAPSFLQLDASARRAFLEARATASARGIFSSLGNAVSSVAGAVGLGGDKKVEDTRPKCCTPCPSEAVSFAQVEARRFFGLMGGSSSSRGGASKGADANSPAARMREQESITIRPDGCCNTCPSSVFENPAMRFEEANGGPYGLRPRLTASAELGELTGDCDPDGLDTMGAISPGAAMAGTTPEPKK